MAQVSYLDRAKKEGVSVSGTTSFDPTTGTTPAGFASLGGFGFSDGSLYPLAIVNTSNSEWEVGFYEWDNTSSFFLRSAGASFVTASPNFNNFVDFTAGSDKTVILVDPAAANTLAEANSNGRIVSALVELGSSISLNRIITQGDRPIRVESVSNKSQTERSTAVVFTGDDTKTQLITFQIPLSASTAVIDYRVVARTTSGSSPFPTKVVAGRFAVAYDGGSRVMVGTPAQTIVGEDTALSGATVTVDEQGPGTKTEINVTGLASTSITWSVVTDVLYLED